MCGLRDSSSDDDNPKLYFILKRASVLFSICAFMLKCGLQTFIRKVYNLLSIWHWSDNERGRRYQASDPEIIYELLLSNILLNKYY